MIDERTRKLLIRNAEKYENADFLPGDPSWFMHQVEGRENREAMAFLASGLSYGSRAQFMGKIGLLMEWSEGNVADWIKDGAFEHNLPGGGKDCFYRLYTVAHMHEFIATYRKMLLEYGTMGNYVEANAKDSLGAVDAICRYFSANGSSPVVPKDTTSACKRVCMFLRWMVRSGSPVDLGLWAHFIDRRTLIMPLDTHVMQQSASLGLISGKCTSMATARRLTQAMAEVFPDDPLKGDFALFGYGVNNK